MKKLLFIYSCVLVISGLAITYFFLQNDRVRAFNMPDYQLFIRDYAQDHPNAEALAPIKNREDAKHQAEILWSKLYGRGFVERSKPLQVYYDPENKAWLVKGSYKSLDYFWGDLYTIIASDGEVLAEWVAK